jgi:hypothetical protein
MIYVKAEVKLKLRWTVQYNERLVIFVNKVVLTHDHDIFMTAQELILKPSDKETHTHSCL